jgi:hypothetical protein
VSRLRHGYTNRTSRDGQGTVEKRYDGPDAATRAEVELACLSHLSGVLPVPEVIGHDPSLPSVTLRDIPGVHGQDAIDAGRAHEVLGLLGSLLAGLQALDVSVVPGLPGRGAVIVHGDFGPQNVLVGDGRVAAILDWEHAHLGSPIEDLAWAEWIVRMHHPSHRDALAALFEAARLEPAWTDRQSAMVDRCGDLVALLERGGPPAAAELWRSRLTITESWRE